MSSKYLGISAKAADSNLLDGIDSTGFLRSSGADDDIELWLRVRGNRGIYVNETNAQLNMDLDVSTNTFNVRGTGNNNILQVSAAGNNVQINKNAHASGANDYHLELYSGNVGASNEVALRLHQGGQYYGSMRLRADGFHFTQGNSNTYRNVYAGTFYGALSGTASNANTVDGYHIVVGSTGTDANTLYFVT